MTAPPLPEDNQRRPGRLLGAWLETWRGAALLIACLTLAASITGLTNGFAYDDVAIVLDNPRIKDWTALWKLFGQPYWSMDGFLQDLYRPMVLLGFGVQWAIGGGNPMVFHAVSILLAIVAALLCLALLRQFVRPRAAVVGAALWAVHPVHVEAVGNVVGQAELLVGIAVLGALVAYGRDRRGGSLRPRTVALVALCYAIGLLSKEHAIVLPALLLVVELVWRRQGSVLAGADASRGWLLARVLVWEALAFLLIRYIVLGAFRGGPHFAWWGLSHGERLLAATALWPEVLRLLVWPARLYADYAPPQFPVRTSFGAEHLLALLLLLGWGWGIRRAWSRRDAALVVGLAVFPITHLTTSNLLFPTGVLLAERTLFLPSLTIGFLAAVLVQRVALLSDRVRRLSAVLVTLLVVLGVGRSAERQRAWADSLTVFSTMVADSPTNGRGHAVIGQLFLGFGELMRAETHLRTAYALHQGYGYLLADLLQRTGACDEVLQMTDSLITKHRSVEPLRATHTICLLEERRFSAARAQVREALVRGFSPRTFQPLGLLADSLLASYDSIDARNAWVRSGKGFDRTGREVTIAVAARPVAGGLGLIFGGRSLDAR
ncbi:MAG: tetratricopeptide repeat protein [Gemmatimonadaceae bacterium]